MVLAGALLPSHDCATCTPALQRQRGCTSRPPVPVQLDGRDLDRCPMRPYKDDPAGMAAAMQAAHWYRRGMLPDPGTVLDQSEPFLAVVEVVETALRDAQDQRDRRDRAARERADKLAESKAARQKGGRKPGRRR